VTNEVLTLALFSYITGTPVPITHEEEEEENAVSAGQNKKNFIPLSK
jgi:hypothetical protein